MQSNIFGSDDVPHSAPTRKGTVGILPGGDKPATRSGRRAPEGVAPNFKSSFSLSHESADVAGTKAAVIPPGLRSSITFGDDGPRDPDFSPKKSFIPARRILTPPGGASAASLAEFAGALPDSAEETEDEKLKKKIDPSKMTAAGSSTGKHRVY
jgi:hypothetical protein